MHATMTAPSRTSATMPSEAGGTRWRVAVDIEFELAATDQEAAITRAEELLEAGIAGLRLRHLIGRTTKLSQWVRESLSSAKIHARHAASQPLPLNGAGDFEGG